MGLSIPGFFGYHNAQRGIMAGQVAINVINHNISNANTPGFSRQRVELEAGNPYPSVSEWSFYENGQTAQGVNVKSITRSHDNFLDAQIRDQSSLKGYHSTLNSTLGFVEGLIGEPSDYGISATMKSFFAAAQALSQHPEDPATRISFLVSGQSLLSTFQDKATQLQELRTGLVGSTNVSGSFATSKAGVTVDQINTEITQIANLNNQILVVQANGAQPNDLLDQRDHLLEELSKKLNVTVTYKEGLQVDVKLGGRLLVQSGTVADTLEYVQNTGSSPAPDDVPGLVQFASDNTVANSSITGGELGGYLKMGGNDPDVTTIRGLLGKLDALFSQIAGEINTLQAGGRDYNGAVPASGNDTVFDLASGTTLSIFRYSVNANLLADSKLVAAANENSGTFAGVGDGRNALEMAKVESKILAGLGNVTVSDYFNSNVARLGVDARAARDKTEGYTGVLQQLDQRRGSLQSVNLEEEMIDLLRFQRGYEASARVMKTIDEVMDRIINGMV